jgi:hypothetical protein
MNVGEFVETVMPTVGEACRNPGGCDDWTDHTCVAGSAGGRGRCAEHCTCLGEPVGYEVSLTMTLPTHAAAQLAARRLLDVARGYAPGQDAAHVAVTQTAPAVGA